MQRLRRALRPIVGIVVAITLLTGGRRVLTAAKQPSVAPACASSEYHQFDFFLGDWDAFDVGSSRVKAHNAVTRMLGGCALREVYSRLDGYSGESFSVYDFVRGRWHQSWVTNRGELLLLDGGLRNGDMVLSGPGFSPAAIEATIRGVWRTQPDGSVRETAEQSSDGGKTWSPMFDLEFRKRTRGAR